MSASQLAQVYVIDDDSGVSQALHNLLDSVNIPHRLYSSSEEFLTDYDGQEGCLLLDVRLRGMSGVMLQQKLNRDGINLPIIFLTGHGNIQMAVKAMRDGAFDFVTKPFHNQELLDTIHGALLSNHDQSQLQQQRRVLQGKIAALTPREKQLLDAIVDGKQTKEIAVEMGISINTAQIHRANLMKKMGARNLGSLINMVIKANLNTRH